MQSKENVSSSPPWKLALENVPLLSDQFCENLIARRNIPFAIRSVARVLAINLQPNLFEKFGVSLDFIANQKLQETNSDNKMIVGNNEISSAFRKLCYFTLVKWSNKSFPPASTKLHLFDIAGVQFIVTRFSEPAMQKVYGSIHLPYISSKHQALLFRLYEQSHIRHNPASSKEVGVCHLPLTFTLTNMRSGDYAAITNAQRKIVSTLVSKCSFCILHGQSERLYSHQPGDPRILEFLHVTIFPSTQ